MEGHPVAGLYAAEVSKECSKLVYLFVEFLVRNRLGVFVLRLGHPDKRCLVTTGRQVAVDTVVGGVQTTADKPFPKRWVISVQRRVPVRVPSEQVGVFLEALGEVLFAESVKDVWVGSVCLGDELRRRVVVVLFSPVNGDLRLGGLRFSFCCHRPLQSERYSGY